MTGRALVRAAGRVAAAGAIVAAVYAFVGRPWHRRWGATDEEVRRPLPGDERVAHLTGIATHAVTIHAPVEAVWPWLLQLGYGRGGFYSYDWLENLFMRLIGATPGYRSVDRIFPEWQTLRPGDFIPAGPRDIPGRERAGWTVQSVDPYRTLILEGWGSFVLEPIDPRTTRLIVRSRSTGAFGRLSELVFWEPAHFVMERRMLLGIKQRAERLAAATPAPATSAATSGRV